MHEGAHLRIQNLSLKLGKGRFFTNNFCHNSVIAHTILNKFHHHCSLILRPLHFYQLSSQFSYVIFDLLWDWTSFSQKILMTFKCRPRQMYLIGNSGKNNIFTSVLKTILFCPFCVRSWQIFSIQYHF